MHLRIWTRFLILLGAWTAIDLNRLRARREGPIPTPVAVTEIPRRQRQRAEHRGVMPPAWRTRRTVKVRSRCKYLSVKSRDRRDSNQRAIRRKCINA